MEAVVIFLIRQLAHLEGLLRSDEGESQETRGDGGIGNTGSQLTATNSPQMQIK
jgi:hypothetical protein